MAAVYDARVALFTCTIYLCLVTLGDGSVNHGYLQRDGVHLTHAAMNRLARNLSIRRKNTASGVCSDERGHQQQHPQPPSTAPRQNDDTEWRTARRRGRPTQHVSGATRAPCYFCGEEGHTKDNCRHDREIECNACHRLGHTSKFCPK